MNRLIAIVGPTATGKTALAVRLAERLAGEIVSADSRQVYRGMDVGTAKPSAEGRARVRHWLIDVADPHETFSLGRFIELAGQALEDIWLRGRTPFLVGGTGQYVWALLEGWRVPRIGPNRAIRQELEAKAAREGPQALAAELTAVDPEAARRIDPRNVRRLVRALEVYRLTGRPISAWQSRTLPECESLVIGLWCERAELYRRIDARVDAMISAGLVEEVQGLLAKGYSPELPAMSGIGYRQICQHLAGALSLEEAVARVKTETHRLARMQHTWFRRDDPRIRWLHVTVGEPFARALSLAEGFLLAGVKG